VLAPIGVLMLSLESQHQVLRAIETLAHSFAPGDPVEHRKTAVRLVTVEAGGVLMERERAPLQHQLKVFQNAKAVIAVHGPLMSYILACSAGTPVLEIGFPATQSMFIGSSASVEQGAWPARRWTRNYRLLAAAVGLPYWAMPASWINEGSTEIAVDALQVAAWLAGPAAQAVGSRAPSALPSSLGDKVRSVAILKEEQMKMHEPPHTGLDHPNLATAARSTAGGGRRRGDEVGLSTEAIVVEGEIGWLVCERDCIGSNGTASGDLAHNQPVRVSSEAEDAGGWGAVDGNSKTRWMTSGLGDQEWLEVDLGSIYPVCAVRVGWGVAKAKAFEIQTSVPGRWEPEYVRNASLTGEEFPKSCPCPYPRIRSCIKRMFQNCMSIK
jgi:hypothetical protein